MKRYFVFVLILLMFGCSSEEKPEKQVYSGSALGTNFQIQYFYHKELELENAIDSTFQSLNQSLSTYLPDSDISKINQGDTSIVVDQQFVTNFTTSKEIYKTTDGYFDPSVGILVNAYGFGPVKYNIKMNQQSIDSLMQFVGLEKVEISADNRVKKQYPETFLDFNSIAKGYAVDRLATLLEQKKIENYLVEVGGEIVANGMNVSKEKSWKVGIDNPKAAEDSERELLQYIIKLENRALATSGNYRKYKTDEVGNKFVHTINPKTGRSEASDVLSASVFAENCMLADAYATAFMAMGFNKTKALLPKLNNIDVILVYANGETIDTYISEGLKEFMIE